MVNGHHGMAVEETEVLRVESWVCDRCGKRGVYRYARRADLLTVLHTVLDAHYKASPDCPDGSNVRVTNKQQEGT